MYRSSSASAIAIPPAKDESAEIVEGLKVVRQLSVRHTGSPSESPAMKRDLEAEKERCKTAGVLEG